MAEQGEPRRVMLTVRAIMRGQHAPDNVLIQFDSETPGQLLGDLGTAQMRVTSFGFKDGLDQGLSRPFRTLYMANWHSSGDWQFKQSVAMALPTVILKTGCLRRWVARFLPGRVAG